MRPGSFESGPAAGVIAAVEVGRRLGLADLISFDMGGTTAKATLVRQGRITVPLALVPSAKTAVPRACSFPSGQVAFTIPLSRVRVKKVTEPLPPAIFGTVAIDSSP